MELADVKAFLRVDSDYEDDYIRLLIDVAREYVVDAVGECDETKARVKLLIMNIVATLYENRQYTIDKKNEKVAYTLHNIVLQLQMGAMQ